LYTLTVLFAIVYSGDHYITDLLAGIFLAYFCFWIAIKWKKPAQETSVPSKTELATETKFLWYKVAIPGILILALGIGTGIPLKNEFKKNTDFLDIHAAVPLYAEFFNHIEKYEDNYKVLFTYGKHLYHKRQYHEARNYFEKARKISNNVMEEKQAAFQIKLCELNIKKSEQNPPLPEQTGKAGFNTSKSQ
jgi:hypothetical protein